MSMSSNSARFDLKNSPLQPFRRVKRYSQFVSLRAWTVLEVASVQLFMILNTRSFFRVESEYAMVNSAVLIPEYRQNALFQSNLSQLVVPCWENGLKSRRESRYDEHNCALCPNRRSLISKNKFPNTHTYSIPYSIRIIMLACMALGRLPIRNEKNRRKLRLLLGAE
jgi:hypothetical protein